MTRHDLMSFLGATACTAVLAASILPPTVPATARVPEPGRRATLQVGGVELTIAPARGEMQPGEMAGFLLTGRNQTDRPCRLRVRVAMQVSTPPSPYARMLPVPREAWSDSRVLTLAGGEERTVEVDTGVGAEAGTHVDFLLEVGGESVQVAGFDVAADELGPGRLGALRAGP